MDLPEGQEQQTLPLRIQGNIARDNAYQWNGNTFTGNTFNITANNHSLPGGQDAGASTEPTPRVLPPRRPNASFVGQEDVLDRMSSTLLPNSAKCRRTSCYALYGIGGVGKSEIALQFVERHDTEYWGIFWVDFESVDTANSGYTSIAEECGWTLSRQDNLIRDVTYRLSKQKQNWLLIMDNCDKSSIDYSTYRPGGYSGAIIITTRQPEVAERYAEENREEISGLDEESAVYLLLKASRLPKEIPIQKRNAAIAIARQLSCHSLAITVAASMLRKGRYGLEEYSEALKRPKTQAELFQTKLKQDMPRYGSAFATFAISVEELLETDPESGRHALDLLSILGFLDRTGVPEDLFTRAWAWGYKHRYNPDKVNLGRSDLSSDFESERTDNGNDELVQTRKQTDGNVESHHTVDGNIRKLWPPHFANALDFAWSTQDDLSTFRNAREMLFELSLIFVSSDSQVITMHPLLHSWARLRLPQEEALFAWSSTAATLCLSSEKCIGWRNFTPLLRPHFESCFESWPDKDANLIPTLDICSTLTQFWWQLYRADSRYCMTIVEQLERRFPKKTTSKVGQVDENHIKVLQMRSHTLAKLGDHRSSLEIDKQIIVAYQKVRSEDHKDLLRAHNSLALSFLELGQTQQALEILHEIVRIGRESFSANDDALLAWQHSLGQALMEEEQSEEAIAVLEDVVQVEKQKLSSTDPGRLTSHHELGRAYLGNGQSRKAVEMLEEVVRIRDETLPPTNQDRLASQHELGRAYLDNGQFHKAAEILEDVVVRIRSETLPRSHRDLLVSKHLLGRAYIQSGQLQDALNILEEVVLTQKSLPALDYNRLTTQHELIRTYFLSGQIDKAAALAKETDEAKNEYQPDEVCAVETEVLGYLLRTKQSEEARKLYNSLQLRADRYMVDDQRARLRRWGQRLIVLEAEVANTV